MSDYISREDAMTIFVDCNSNDYEARMFKRRLKVVSSADVRENIHGEWIKMGEAYVCSRCSTTCACTEMADKWIWHTDDKFCRGCGADMRTEPYKAESE